MHALKILVVVMGVILVLGTVALVAAVINRAHHRRELATASGQGAVNSLLHIEPVHIDLPAGAHVASTELAGDRILVHVVVAPGKDELVLFDARNGSRIATLDLQAGASDARVTP